MWRAVARCDTQVRGVLARKGVPTRVNVTVIARIGLEPLYLANTPSQNPSVHLFVLPTTGSRFPKRYRHPELDAKLTKQRILGEVRAIARCKDVG